MTSSLDRAGRATTVAALAAAALALIVAMILWRPWARDVDVPLPPASTLEGLEPALADAVRARAAGVREAPDDAATWGRLGGVYDAHELDALAIRCYEQAQALDATDFRWPYFLGIARAIGDQRAAVEDFRRALALRADHAPIHVHLGRGLLFTERYDEAKQRFEEAAALDPGLIRAQLGLAQVALARGDTAKAIAHLEAGRERGPVAGEVDYLLAEAHRRQGDAAAAERHLAVARTRAKIEPLPDAVRRDWTWQAGATLAWRRARSDGYQAEGRLGEAAAEWEEALREDPGSAEAHGQLGLVHAKMGRTNSAIERFTRSLELEPDQPRVRTVLGTLLVSRGEHERGLALLREACAAEPDRAAARLELAAALILLERWDDARAALEQTLVVDPDHARARFEYGVLLARLGRTEEAIAALRRAAGAAPDKTGVHLHLARALGDAGRDAEAVAALREGVAHLPDNPQLAVLLAWRLATSPDPAVRDGAEALRLAERLVRAGAPPDPRVLDTLAAAHAETGDFETAARVAGAALTLLAARRPSGALDELREAILERQSMYERGVAYREESGRRR